MFVKSRLKRYFIITIIAAMSISALVGIVTVLTASFGEIQARILLTTLAIGMFSITSLANLANLESVHPSYRRFSILSILFSITALAFAVMLIWLTSLDNAPWKPTLVFIILAVSTAHASLLLAARGKSKFIDIAATTTLASIAFVAGFLIYLVLAEASDIGDVYYRLLAVFAILDVLGTVVVPILSKVMKSKQVGPATPVAHTPTMPEDTALQVLQSPVSSQHPDAGSAERPKPPQTSQK